MPSKRLWERFNRSGSFSYWEIVLETLVVLVVVTELSMECGKASFPDWQQSRVEPTARFHYTELVTGIPLDRLLNPCQPIDGKVPSNEKGSRMGCALLLCVTAALYATFAAFLLANRKWKPPIFLTDQSAAKQCRWFSHAVLSTYSLYGVCIINSVNYLGWEREPRRNYLYSFLLGMWFAIIVGCGPRDGQPMPSVVKKASQKAKTCIADAQRRCGYAMAWAVVLLCAPVVLVGVFAIACAGLFVFGAVLGLFLSISTISAVGLVRSVVAIFGETAAFPGLVVVLCLLITHCFGRMSGIWLAESSIVWVVKKLRSMRNNTDITENCSSNAVPVAVDASYPSTEGSAKVPKDMSRHSATKFLLDNMVVAVMSSALWFLYVGGTTRNPNDANLFWHVLTTGKLPQCFSTMMTELFSATTKNSPPCLFLNHPFSPMENTAMDASFAFSGLLTFLLLPPWFGILFMLFMRFAGFGVICCYYRCCYRYREPKPSIPQDLAEVVPSNGLYDFHRAMGLLPLYFVKVVVPWYALDFLPGKWYIPGIGIYLLGYSGCLLWVLMKNTKAWMKGAAKWFKKKTFGEPCKEKVELMGRQSCTETV